MEPAYAVITHNVVSMRAEPHGNAEQVSQAILGDTVLLLEERDEYARIRTADEYEGWVLRGHLHAYCREEKHWPLQNPEYARRMYRVIADVTPLYCGPGIRYEIRTKLVFGTWALLLNKVCKAEGEYIWVIMPGPSEWIRMRFDTSHLRERPNYIRRPEREYLNYVPPPEERGLHSDVLTGDGSGFHEGYIASDALLKADKLPPFHGKTACNIAHQFIGTPYLWGGTTPFGFDCSGFVQRIYSFLGVTLPRDAYQQAQSPLGTFASPGKTLWAGDLVFFRGQSDPRNRGITHVGMALDNRRFIHAYSKDGVVISGFDDSEITRAYTYVGSWRYRLPRGRSRSEPETRAKSPRRV